MCVRPLVAAAVGHMLTFMASKRRPVAAMEISVYCAGPDPQFRRPRRRCVDVAAELCSKSEVRSWLLRMWTSAPGGAGSRVELEHNLECMESWAKRCDIRSHMTELASELMQERGIPYTEHVDAAIRAVRLPDSVRAAHDWNSTGEAAAQRSAERVRQSQSATGSVVTQTLHAIAAESELPLCMMTDSAFFDVYNSAPTRRFLRYEGRDYEVDDSGVMFGRKGWARASICVPFGMLRQRCTHAEHVARLHTADPVLFTRCFACGCVPAKSDDWHVCRHCLSATWCDECASQQSVVGGHADECAAAAAHVGAFMRRLCVSGPWAARTTMAMLGERVAIPVSLAVFTRMHNAVTAGPPDSVSLWAHARANEVRTASLHWPMIARAVVATAAVQPPDFPSGVLAHMVRK